MNELELQAVLMIGYGYRPERDLFGDVQWRKGNPLLRANPLSQEREYDGSYVENHCPECNEYESECVCSGDDSDDAPYCSYGHKTKATCDCGQIADNE